MMRLAEDWAREADYEQLYLETHSNLTTAMRLYEKLGFQEIEKPSTVLHGTMDHFTGRGYPGEEQPAETDQSVFGRRIWHHQKSPKQQATYVMCPAALEIFVFEETKGRADAYLEK